MYRLVYEERARKDLEKISFKDAERIHKKIKGLRLDPRRRDIKKLEDRGNIYRMRHGNYRIIFTINDQQKHISVTRIRHRKDAYRW